MLEQLCRGDLVTKTRYKVPALEQGLTWEVDVFEDKNEGLVLAELEVESEEQAFAIPEWIRGEDEVTADGRYTNAELSKKPYMLWPKSGGPS